MSILRVENLVKTYPGARKTPPVEAVRGLSFTVEPGEFFGLLGPNGAGKSTTLGCISTLVRPTSGRIVVDGIDVARDTAEAKRRIAVVPQTRNLDRDLTVRELLTYHGRILTLDTPLALKKSLPGGQVLDLWVSAPQPIAPRLRALGGVLNLEAVEDGKEGDGLERLRLFVDPADGLLDRVLHAVRDGGADLRHVSLSQPSLEDVYIHLTGRGLRE